MNRLNTSIGMNRVAEGKPKVGGYLNGLPNLHCRLHRGVRRSWGERPNLITRRVSWGVSWKNRAVSILTHSLSLGGDHKEFDSVQYNPFKIVGK